MSDFLTRFKELSKINESNQATEKPNRDLIKKHYDPATKKTYAIVKENAYYYLKKADGNTDLKENFVYLQGTNKLDKNSAHYRYNNYKSAERNFLIYTKQLNENAFLAGAQGFKMDEDEEEMDDTSSMDSPAPEPSPEPEPTPAPTADTPEPEPSLEPEPEVAPQPESQPEPEPATDEPEPQPEPEATPEVEPEAEVEDGDVEPEEPVDVPEPEAEETPETDDVTGNQEPSPKSDPSAFTPSSGFKQAEGTIEAVQELETDDKVPSDMVQSLFDKVLDVITSGKVEGTVSTDWFSNFESQLKRHMDTAQSQEKPEPQAAQEAIERKVKKILAQPKFKKKIKMIEESHKRKAEKSKDEKLKKRVEKIISENKVYNRIFQDMVKKRMKG